MQREQLELYIAYCIPSLVFNLREASFSLFLRITRVQYFSLSFPVCFPYILLFWPLFSRIISQV